MNILFRKSNLPKRENIEWAKFPSSLNQFKRNKHIQDIDRPEREHGNKKKKASNSYLPCYSPSYTSYAFYRGSYIFVLFSSVICSGNNFFTNFYSMQFSLCICNFFESLRSPLPFLLIAMNGHFLVFSFFHSKRRAQNYWSNYPLDWSGMQRMQTFVFAWMVCWIQCTRTFWVAKTNVSNNKVNASFTSTNIHTHIHPMMHPRQLDHWTLRFVCNEHEKGGIYRHKKDTKDFHQLLSFSLNICANSSPAYLFYFTFY